MYLGCIWERKVYLKEKGVPRGVSGREWCISERKVYLEVYLEGKVYLEVHLGEKGVPVGVSRRETCTWRCI